MKKVTNFKEIEFVEWSLIGSYKHGGSLAHNFLGCESTIQSEEQLLGKPELTWSKL